MSDAPRGPPPPHPVRITVDNAARHTRPVQFQECNFSVWVGTPYHVPETLQFPLRLPCDIEDALDATERHVQSLKLDYCDRAIAVRPQPFASCAAVILAPDWSTYSALSVVCLDLRDLGEHTDGPVIVSFVTRPTCLAELCREASVHDTSHCRVYLGTDTAPMQPDEEVHLASGCLVTFMRTDRLPCFSNDLQFRLQFPSVWTLPPRFPASPAIRSSLLLLHSSGRYLYRPQASHDPGDIAAARFVGVNRAEVDFHTPRPGSIERVMYRGIRVRGVIAIADRLYEEQFVVFLDLRQVAEGIQFVVLATPHLPLTALPNLLHTQPPPGWVLQVTGGRRRRDRIYIVNGDTLTFGYKYVCDSDASEVSFDPTTDDEEGEDGESDDPESDRSLPCSAATTRSRSRRRRSPGQDSAPSSDQSYCGGLDLLHKSPAAASEVWSVPWLMPLLSQWRDEERVHGGGELLRLDLPGCRPFRASHADLVPALACWLATSDASPGCTKAACQALAQLKLLSEPVSHTVGQGQRMHAVRDAIEYLGGVWRYHAPNIRLHAGMPILEEFSSDEDADGRTRRASFVICVPDYTLERLVIEVRFPATLAEVTPLLRQARPRDRDFRFPHLTPASPQPLDGTGVFVATPHWCAGVTLACIDSTRLDGRLFAASLPTYVDRHTLLETIQVQDRAVAVYVGLDQSPLQHDVLAHVVLGTTITVLPLSASPPPMWDIGHMLLDAGHWSSHVMLAALPAHNAYCLVWESRHQLFRANSHPPSQFRTHLAEAIGEAPGDVVITPAQPQIRDAAVTGTPCQTVLAATSAGLAIRSGQPHTILLDGRLREGWFTWQAYNGLLFLPDLLQFLQRVVPPGHSLSFAGAPDLGVHMQTPPGTTVVLDFVLRPPPIFRAAQHLPGIYAAGSGLTDTGAATQEQAQPAGPPAPTPAISGGSPADGVIPATARPNDGRDAEGSEIRAIFLVFTPGYLPELLEVALPSPATVPGAVAAVGSVRSPDSVSRFPHLLEVRPQPDTTYGTLLALPEWPTTDILVYFDLRGIDDRYFALHVPSAMTFASLLAVADLAATTPATIYVRDMPWPLGPSVRVELLPGDLVVITRPHHPVLVHASLHDMLQDSQGWATELDIPGEYGDRTWLVTDHEPVRYNIDRRRAAAFRGDVAAVLDISSSTLLLQPVWPHILDFADHGLLIRSVLIAVEPPALTEQGPERWIVCLLDMRPILLGFVVAYAPDGQYQVTRLIQRLQAFCPAGFQIVVRGGHRRSDGYIDCRTVFAGEVLTVTFQAVPASAADAPSVGPNSAIRLAGHDHPGSSPDAAEDLGSAAPLGSTSSGSAAVAGTGSRESGAQATLDPSDMLSPRGRSRPHHLHSGRGLAAVCLALLCQPLRAVQLLQPPADIESQPASKPPFLHVAPAAPAWPHSSACSPRTWALPGVSSVARRPVPTPCRARGLRLDVADDSRDGRLATLLEECVATSDTWAFLAATLLDTLLDHCAAAVDGSGPAAPAAAPTLLHLEHDLPVTPFQSQVLELLDILPAVSHASSEDWLDNDLGPILQFSEASLALRTALLDVPLWHEAPRSIHATHLEVFTDGSASGPSEPLRTAPAGWAFTVWVVAGHRSYFYGAAYSTAVPPGTPFYLGETRDTPLQSELLGICWALVWLFEYGPTFQLPCVLRFDCQAAGRGTFCQATPAALPAMHGRPSISRLAVLLRQCVERRMHLRGDYVPGHAGHLGNELSDSFAKYARCYIQPLEERVLPSWPARLSQHSLARWAWLCAAPIVDFPTLFAFEPTAGYLQTRPHADRSPPIPPSPTPTAARVVLTCMTYNVLTLFDGKGCPVGKAKPTGLRLVGKRHLITQQCEAQGVHLLGLQETRLQETATLHDSRYILLHAAADERGHFGCALWLSKCLPYAHAGATPLFFEPAHCTVVAFSPRHLLVSLDAPSFPCAVLVAHAPSDPTGADGLATAFWRDRAAELQRLPKGREVIVLADANGRLGDHVSPAVGNYGLEAENPGGLALHDFLLAHNLCAPATFSHVHRGESWTWCSPTGHVHRLDYVGTPQAWLDFTLSSHIWYTFEALQKRQDHVPAVLRCQFQARSVTNNGPDFRRRACRPNDLDPALDVAAFRRALTEQPQPAWELGVDAHFAQLSRSWLDAGRVLQQPAEVLPRQSYLSLDTLRWVAARKSLQHYLRAERQEYRRRRLLIGFAGFLLHTRGGHFTLQACVRADAWLMALDRSIAQAWASYNFSGRFLRCAVRQDRNRYLDSLVQDVRAADLARPKQLFQRVRKAFPKAASSRRSAFVALPAVELETGDLAATGEQRAQRWREHFAAQESGVAVTAAEYLNGVLRVDRRRVSHAPCFDPTVLPDLAGLEEDILRLRRGKAAGPDGITGELLRVQPALAARHFLSLHLKSTLALREPVEYKGGALMTLAKKAAAVFRCDRHRSILLSSVPGKLFHRGIRSHLAPALRKVCPDLHGGVRSHVGVDTISLAVKCFQSCTRHQGELPALVFYDVRAAYYQVLRETLTGDDLDDSVIRSLFHRLGVPPSAFEELRSLLAGIASLADCCDSEHALALTREVFTGTWFRLDRSAPLVATAAGVRPGDPLADLLFAVSFSAYISAVQATLVDKQLHTPLAAGRSDPPWQAPAPPTVLGPASWADDFVAMHAAADGPSLLARVRAATSVFLTHATANGIQLAFGPEKTAALLPPAVGFGAHPGIHKQGNTSWLEITDGITGAVQCLPLVQAYKHLGGIVTSGPTVVPEIHYRHSQAAWSLRPLRGPLFGNPSIPISTRRHLLRSLVVSKFLLSTATIELHVHGHWRLWARFYVALWSALQPRTTPMRRAHSFAVLHLAQAVSPPLAFARARAGLLLRILEHGPATLRHLLFLQWEADAERSWLGLLRQDIQHVALYCPAAGLLLTESSPVRALIAAVQEDRTWWRRQILAAERLCLKDLQGWYAKQAASRPSRPFPASEPAPELPFACPFCDSRFALRKHRGTHSARRHKIPSPARLFSFHPACLVCLRYYHTIARLQRHLKGSPPCLRRTCLLAPPMDVHAITVAEDAGNRKAHNIRAGQWQEYAAAQPVLPTAGPVQPTRDELRQLLDDDAPLSLLADSPANTALLCWAIEEASYRTREPPRTAAASFWHRRIS